MSDIYKSCPIIENERFWHSSYEKGWFVRWSVTNKAVSKVTGTIELFRREAEEAFNEAGVLRELFSLIIPLAYDLFECTQRRNMDSGDQTVI